MKYVKLSTLRTGLLFVAAILFTVSCSSSTTSSEMGEKTIPEATIVLENNGAQSYTVTTIQGDSANSEMNSENPDITLVTGGRYTFINNAGASSHPLDFRDADRQKLFGQSRQSGSLDENDFLQIEKDGDAITFTLTEELAEVIMDYVCSFHPGMNGLIVVLEE